MLKTDRLPSAVLWVLTMVWPSGQKVSFGHLGPVLTGGALWPPPTAGVSWPISKQDFSHEPTSAKRDWAPKQSEWPTEMANGKKHG